MPFDGTQLQAPTVLDPPTVLNTGLFPLWSKQGWRVWFESPVRAPKHTGMARVLSRASPGADRDAAVIRLLQDARKQIEDPRHWAKGTYRSLRRRRCAVGALRAAARCLHDPSIAWSAHALLIKVAGSRRFSNVEMMNDRSCHAAVLGAFDEAIAAAQAIEAARRVALAVA
jgi:hypothetical protein